MKVIKNRLACKADIGLCDQKKESGGEGIRRLGSMLRVLVPAVLISIALIACPDSGSSGGNTTPADTTAPTVSGPRSAQSGTTATVDFSINEIGKLFWVTYTAGTTGPADAAALIAAAGQTPSGRIVAVSGSDGQTVSAVGVQTIMVTGLSVGNSYDFYLIAQDAAGNISGLTNLIGITTAPTIAPIVSGVSAGDITNTSATVNVSTTKTGKLFWVAYADDTTAPADAAALISAAGRTPGGTIIANSGRDGQTVSPVDVQTVMVTGLLPGISYDFYLVAQDMMGNNSNVSAKLDITTVADTAAPTVTNPSAGSTTDTGTTISFSVNEAGKLFWVFYADGTTGPADAAALITAAGQTVASPIIASSGGSGTVSAVGAQTVPITGLSAGTIYDFYLIAQDATGNNSPILSALDIVTTASAIAPIITSAVVRTNSVTSTSFGLNITVSKASTLVWAIYASGATAPATAAAVITAAGQAPSGAVIANSLSPSPRSISGNGHFTITGLSGSDSYDVYLVARDAADAAIASVVTKLVVTTSSQFFLGANGVTIFCPNVAVGATGTVGGVTYTRWSSGAITADNAATTCTSGLAYTSGLFADEATFDADIRSWDVSSVVGMSNMFSGAAAFNQDIGIWDVSSVTDMSNMFSGATAFNQNIGIWDVSSVTDTSGMFSGITAFNQNIGGWNVSKVTSMNGMFANNTEFDQDISGWDVSSVTDMSNMLNSALAFNQNIGGWNVSSVTDMNSMFADNAVFNQNIGGWDVSSVTGMNSMFADNTVFNQNIGGWDVSSVTGMNSMFADNAVFNQNISGWVVSSVTGMSNMFGGATAFNQNISGWDVSKVTSMSAMFANTRAFNQNISGWTVTSVTDMSGMFANTTVFNQDISGWTVSSVTDMSAMFGRAAAFNRNIGSWDVSNVTSMKGMFSNAVAFNQDISGWTVRNVTDMSSMFLSAAIFNQNLSGWCVSGFDLAPSQFSTGSAIARASFPRWGDDAVSSCPVAVSSPTSVATTRAADVSFTVNKIGKIFWVAYTDGTAAPTNAAALVIVASQPVGSPIIASSGSGGQAVTAVGEQTVDITGLSPGTRTGSYFGAPNDRTPGTAYDVYIVAQDAAGNNSILAFLDIATAPNCLTAFYDFVPGQGCRQ